MQKNTTSAGQLNNILQSLLVQNDANSTEDVWRYALNLPGLKQGKLSHPQKLYDSISQVLILCSRVKQDIAGLEESFYGLGINAISKIEASIIQNSLKDKWVEVKKRHQISEDTLNIIKIYDGLLIEKRYQQVVLEEAKKEELLSKVNNLINEFCVSNLPNNLKLELIAELRKIQHALINFNVTGEAHIQKVCHEVIGDIITKASEKPKLFKQFKKSVQKVVNTAVMIGGLMTTYDLSLKYYPILTEGIINLIDNMPEENDDKQPQLSEASTTQEMNAEIESNTNNKCLPSGEED